MSEWTDAMKRSRPHELDYINRIAQNLLKWDLVKIEKFGTPKCTKRQEQLIDAIATYHLEVGVEYWFDELGTFFIRRDAWNPFEDVNSALHIVERTRHLGIWKIVFPEFDKHLVEFTPHHQPPIIRVCFTLPTAIAYVAVGFLELKENQNAAATARV